MGAEMRKARRTDIDVTVSLNHAMIFRCILLLEVWT